MKNITISICTNRDCFTEGATLFKQLDSIMYTSLKSKFTLTGTECCGHCAECGISQAPCAKVNGKLLSQATPGAVMQEIRECLGEKRRVA